MNKFLAIGAVVLAVAGATVLWQAQRGQGPVGAGLPYGAANAQEAADIDTSGIVEMTLGVEDAPVSVIEYASFTCPHCASFHAGPFKRLKADYIDSGKVRFTYRDVYFDRFGLWASMVARCGGSQRFFGLTDLIYDQQREWLGDGEPVEIADNLRRIGKVAGLEEDQLDACLSDSDKARTLVAWYQQNAEQDDVSSTPTLIIDGVKHANMSYPELKALIDDALDS